MHRIQLCLHTGETDRVTRDTLRALPLPQALSRRHRPVPHLELVEALQEQLDRCGLAIISAGIQLSQIPSYGQNFQGPTAGNVLGAAVGQQFGSVSADLLRRGMSIAPTLEIRPGYPFNILVTQDLVFPGPYDDARQP